MKDPVSLKLTFSARDKVFFSYSEYFILIMSGHAANIIQNRWSHYLYSIPTVQGKKCLDSVAADLSWGVELSQDSDSYLSMKRVLVYFSLQLSHPDWLLAFSCWIADWPRLSPSSSVTAGSNSRLWLQQAQTDLTANILLRQLLLVSLSFVSLEYSFFLRAPPPPQDPLSPSLLPPKCPYPANPPLLSHLPSLDTAVTH